jgi:hypothetical protein
MQAQGSEGQILIGEELTFKSTPSLEIHTCEAAWDELVDGDATVTADAAVFKVGTKSCKAAIAAPMSAGDIICTDSFAAKDLSLYKYLAFWVRSSVVLSAGDIQVLLDETAQCASPLETLDVPAVPTVDTWQYCKVAMVAPASCTAIISIGLKLAVDKAAMDFYIDGIVGLSGEALILPFISEGLKVSKNLISSNVIRSSRQPQRPSRGNKEVAGDIQIEYNPYMQRILKHALGSYSVAGAGAPYTHTFTIGTLPTALIIEKGFTDIAQYFRYNGCRINSLSMDIKPEGAITGSIGIMGAKETIDTLPYDSDPVDYGHIQFEGFDITITEGVTALGTATAINFTLENNLDGSVFVLDGTGERYSMPSGKAKVTGKLTALFEDTTLYNKGVNNTETALVITLTKGTGAGTAGNEKLTIHMDEMIFKQDSPVISGPTGVVLDLSFEAYYDNGAGVSALWMELLNAEADL